MMMIGAADSKIDWNNFWICKLISFSVFARFYFHFSKGGLVEETVVCNSQHTAKFEFFHPGIFGGFCKEKNWVPHCKTLAQLILSDSKTKKDSS